MLQLEQLIRIALVSLVCSTLTHAREASTESLVDGSRGGGIISQGASFNALPLASSVEKNDLPLPRSTKDLSPGGIPSDPASNIKSLVSTPPIITKNSLPLHPSRLPTVTIGVSHADPVSNKVVSGSLRILSKIGYNTYGVELPLENQAGINAFVSVYDKTKNITQAKEAYWQGQLNYWHANPEKYGRDWDPSTVRGMDLTGLKSSDQSGYQDSLLERMAIARDLGMNIEAIDAPHQKVAEAEENINNSGIQQQIDEQGVTSSAVDSLKQLAISDDRNSYLAGNLKPGMVAEVGALHTDGPKPVNNLAAISGKQTISFDSYSPIISPTADDSPYGGVVLIKPPSVQTMIDTLNNSPKK